MFKQSLFLFLCAIQFVFAQDTLRLPLHFENGYGPFLHRAAGSIYRPAANSKPLGEWDGFCKCLPELKNIPKNWEKVNRIDFSLNYYQEIYQCYSAGNMTKEFFEERKLQSNWTPDDNFESVSPLNCYITFIQGIDEKGKECFMLDKNNNHDFADDKEIKIAYSPKVDKNGYLLDNNRWLQLEDSLMRNPSILEMSYIYKGEKKDTTANYIAYVEGLTGELVLSFPTYGKVYLSQEAKEFPLAVEWYFSAPYQIFETNKLIPILHDSLNYKTADKSLFTDKDGFFKIEGQTYQFLGADRKTREVILVKYDKMPFDYLPQEGFLAPLFEATDAFGNIISLESLRGKYVLLDFWGTGCKPCIEEMPEMQKLHNVFGNGNFVLLGIAEGNKDRIAAITQMQGATYAQIIGKDSEDLFKKYNVTGLPRTFLINPQGYVMKRDWRSWDFKEKLGGILRN